MQQDHIASLRAGADAAAVERLRSASTRLAAQESAIRERFVGLARDKAQRPAAETAARESAENVRQATLHLRRVVQTMQPTSSTSECVSESDIDATKLL
jgi:hypothetical protein